MHRDPEVDAYIAAADEKRRPTLEAIRQLCLDELDGFEELITYRMPTYLRGGDPANGGIAFANQKQYISIYVGSDVMERHRDQLGGADCGKGCIRYRSPEKVDLDVLRRIVRATKASASPTC